MRSPGLDKYGKEIQDPSTKIIVGPKKPQSLDERIEEAIRGRMSLLADDQGWDTLEESQDFDVQDPFDFEAPNTVYEVLKDEWLDPPSSGSRSSHPQDKHNEADQEVEDGLYSGDGHDDQESESPSPKQPKKG